MRAVSEIVAELVRGVGEGRDVNLNTLKSEVSLCHPVCCGCGWKAGGQQYAGAVQAGRRNGLSKLPKLVEIINAVPEEHRATLLPQCVWALWSGTSQLYEERVGSV